MSLRSNTPVNSGNANTLVSGSVIVGPTLFLGGNYRKVANLSAQVSVTAATSTITFTGSWQTSPDGSTWTAFVPANNAANVIFATGTLAAKAGVFDAPEGVYGNRFARFVLTTGVTTGATGDLYSIGYNYRQLTGSEAA